MPHNDIDSVTLRQLKSGVWQLMKAVRGKLLSDLFTKRTSWLERKLLGRPAYYLDISHEDLDTLLCQVAEDICHLLTYRISSKTAGELPAATAKKASGKTTAKSAAKKKKKTTAAKTAKKVTTRKSRGK